MDEWGLINAVVTKVEAVPPGTWDLLMQVADAQPRHH